MIGLTDLARVQWTAFMIMQIHGINCREGGISYCGKITKGY